MELYNVNDLYINHLKEIDSKVPNNYGEEKPFVGVLIKIDGYYFLAPLSSGKDKHYFIKNSDPRTFKIWGYDKNKKENIILAIIQLNNMIPVKLGLCTRLDLYSKKKKKSYQDLVNEEINYIRKNKSIIISKAKKTYKIKLKNTSYMADYCCDFESLKIACEKF